MKKKRQHVSAIRKALHPPVSQLNRKRAVEYIFGVARELGVDWEPFFLNATQRKRIPKNCFKLSGPQGNAGAADVAVYPKIAKAKRKPSAYNVYMKKRLAELKSSNAFGNWSQKELFKKAAMGWKEQQRKDNTEAAQNLLSLDRTAKFKAMPANQKKIPKKQQSEPELTDAQLRDQLTSMGLPTSFV